MSSLALMCVYTVISLALQALVIAVIVLIEPLLAGWSGVIFITSYLLIFWVAWVISVRLTELKDESATAAHASKA